MFNRTAPLFTRNRFIPLFIIPTMIVSGIILPGALGVRPTQANALVVTSLADSGPGTLRDTIGNASSGDTITFSITTSPAKITLISGQLTISTNLTIDGSNGGNLIIVDGNNSSRVFQINSGSMVSLQNLTIQNGYVTGNEGGGIKNSGTLTVSNSILSNNMAPSLGNGAGGGIANTGTGILTVSNSTLSSNSANIAGAIYNIGTFAVSSSILSNNTSVSTADANGGGIANWGKGTGTINSSTFSNNAANGHYSNGGGIDNSSTLTISSSTFSGNSAFAGGGVYNTGTLTISSSTLSGNTAHGFGGGVYNNGTLTISSSTVFGNRGDEDVGGIDTNGTATLLSTIVAGNTTGRSVTDIQNPVNSLGHNLIGDGSASGGFISSDQVGTSASPIDPALGVLQNNGGLTFTQAITTSSPAYQRGDCSGSTAITPNIPAVTIDQRGYPRKTNCDVGAYEAGTFLPTATATNTYTPTNTATSTLLPGPIDLVGAYRAGAFYLASHNWAGNKDISIAFNPAAKPFPIVGNWTGAGYDTIGVYDQRNGNFALRNSNTAGAADESFTLGNPNDTPLSGRWMASATHAGAGVYRPSNGILYVKNALSTGFADHAMVLGIPGDQGIIGDWTGKGFDSVGVYRPGGITFYLNNQISDGIINGDISFAFGTSVDLAITGDWIGQGHDGVGTFRPNNGQISLKNALLTGNADNAFIYGVAGDQPIAGHWQVDYPPVAPKSPAPLLIQKTAAPYSTPDNGSVPGGNGIGG